MVDRPAPKRPRVYKDDEERVDGYLERLPQTVNRFLSMEDVYTPRQLRRACAQYNIPTEGRERAELEAELVEKVPTCTICQDAIAFAQCTTILLCGHEFHTTCIRRAMHRELRDTKLMPRCPVCRASLRPESTGQ